MELPLEEFQSRRHICFSKNTIVIHQGQQMNNLYFILKGIVRGYYLDEDGREVTKCFSKEQELFGVEGFLYHRAASFSIECLENVECIEVSYSEIEHWMNQNQEHTAMVNELMINGLRVVEDRAKELLLSDAKERYERFMTEQKDIASRLSQKCIASYLGINEASLCRLKKKLT